MPRTQVFRNYLTLKPILDTFLCWKGIFKGSLLLSSILLAKKTKSNVETTVRFAIVLGMNDCIGYFTLINVSKFSLSHTICSHISIVINCVFTRSILWFYHTTNVVSTRYNELTPSIYIIFRACRNESIFSTKTFNLTDALKLSQRISFILEVDVVPPILDLTIRFWI